MKKVIILYKKHYELPDEMSDTAVVSQMLAFISMFFMLGFAMSQLIILLIR